jgi:hypothetical protein
MVNLLWLDETKNGFSPKKTGQKPLKNFTGVSQKRAGKSMKFLVTIQYLNAIIITNKR